MITLIKHLDGKSRALSFKYDKVILGSGKVVSEVKGQVKVQLKMIKIIHFFSHFFESHGHSGKKSLLHDTK